MMSKSIRSVFILIFLLVFCSSLVPTNHVHALTGRANLPALDAFVEQIKSNDGDELRGVYIPEILAARIVTQPDGMQDFVSPWQDVLTEFSLASSLGSTGLLAHNDLAGKSFSQIQPGQQIYLVYGDGHVSTLIVTEILHFRALEPNSIASSFVDMESGDVLTSSELFTSVYHRPAQVVFQTCLAGNDSLTWGRLFIIAEPV
jgi:hypothetical protein